MGDRYWFEYSSKSPEFQTFSTTVAFDGKSNYRISSNGERLYISSKPFEDFYTFLSGNRAPFLAFDFLRVRGSQITIASLISDENLKCLTKRLDFAGAKESEVSGKKCFAIRVKDSFDRSSDRLVDYIVYFSPTDALFPVAWEMLSKDGKILRSFQISKLRKISPPNQSEGAYYLPEIATLIGNEHSDGKDLAAVTEILEFPDTQINELDADAFSPDPGKFDYINDLDADVLIAVPK